MALGHGGGAPTRGREGGRAEEDQHRVGKAMGYLDWRKWGQRDGLHARRRAAAGMVVDGVEQNREGCFIGPKESEDKLARE